MRILICGIDGYLGWALAQYLRRRGHQISGIDNLSRRKTVKEVGGASAFPIAPIRKRVKVFEKFYGPLEMGVFDVSNYRLTKKFLKKVRPDAIVHFGEMPSAPYSMIDYSHAAYTHKNNVLGTLSMLFAMREVCPETHLVKLGTMGEYGTPEVDIPEGFFEVEFRGRKSNLLFPRKPGSFYHATKVHDSFDVDFACRIWDLRSTDIMQGVVYGTHIEGMELHEALRTRFDYDGVFGTAINRFVVQSIVGHPITLFGKGHQKRGFLPLKDSMQCIGLIIESPPEIGEYRIFNQLEEVYDLTELAEKVQKVGREFGLDPEINNITNPRVELEDHYYKVDYQKLLDLGYKPTSDMEAELRIMFADLIPFKDRIKVDALMPNVKWR